MKQQKEGRSLQDQEYWWNTRRGEEKAHQAERREKLDRKKKLAGMDKYPGQKLLEKDAFVLRRWKIVCITMLENMKKGKKTIEI